MGLGCHNCRGQLHWSHPVFYLGPRGRVMEAVVCQGLSKHYGQLVALQNLSLNVKEGSLFGFLGPNGAGKTTALRILAGLSRATGGKAWIAGEEVGLNSTLVQRKIGYLPEEPAFYNWMTGREYLDFTGQLFHLSFGENKKRRQELLEMVGLASAGNRRIGGYSRGMKQRLGIAQALMNQPAVLLLDEPCSALDPLGRLEILETLVKLKERTTVFMSSHILNDVERVCDVVAILNKGQLVVESGVEDLRQRYARPMFELEFDTLTASLLDLLKQIPGVQRVFELKREPGIPILRVQVVDPVRDRQPLLRAIAENNLTLRRYEMVLPSLEEIFVELVGNKEQS
jgi:ABC-2 type transport system ATP-binding protein